MLITLEEAKQYLRVDSASEDTLIQSFLESAESIKKAGETVRQIILGTQIIPDNSKRFSCPPIVVRGE